MKSVIYFFFFLATTFHLKSCRAEVVECAITECQNERNKNTKCMPRHFKNYVEGKFTIEQRSSDVSDCPLNYARFNCCLVPKVIEECVTTDCQNSLTRNTKCMGKHFQHEVSVDVYRIETRGSDAEGCNKNFAKYTCCLIPRGTPYE